MKKLTLLNSILLIVQLSSAQVVFQKTLGGTANYYIGNSVHQTTDGGYIITGYTTSFGAGMGDMYLIKTDINGDTLWTKSFGGSLDDIGRSLQQTTDGGYIIVGNTGSFGAGSADVYLIRTDANGDTLWSKTFGGTGADNGNSVQQTTDGGYIITGLTSSFGAGAYDVNLIKTDSLGNLLWSKTFGSTNDDDGYFVQQTTDGGYIIVGSFQSPKNIHLIKTDVNGNLIWRKAFGGSGNDYGMCAKQTTDGGYVITGWTTNFGAGFDDMYLIKTNSSGDTLWSKTFGGTNAERGYDVHQTSDDGYIIAGYTVSFGAGGFDVYLVKTDVSGNLVWSKTFGGAGGSDYGYSVQQTLDNGFIIGGISNSFTGSNASYLIKIDSLGNGVCNQGSAATIVTSPQTQVTNPATTVSSPTTVVTSPATMVGSGNVITTLCSGTVSVNEIIYDNSFLIYPNPSTGNFSISFDRIIISGNVEILNAFGETIFANNISKELNKEINLKNISKGIYLVKIFSGVKSYCEKIIIE